MDTHDDRAGPGAKKGEQGSRAKLSLPPDQPQARDQAAFYANASGDDSPTFPSGGLTDFPHAGRQSASGEMPQVPLSGTDTGWSEVDGIRARVVILKSPDGGRLSRCIQDLLLDGDAGGPPPDDHDALSGVRELVPVSPRAGGSAAAVAAAVPERELVLV